MTQAVAVWNKARSLTATASTFEHSTASKKVTMWSEAIKIQLLDLSKFEKRFKKHYDDQYFSSCECGGQIGCIFSAGASPTEAGVRIWNTEAICLPTGYPHVSAVAAMLTRPVIKEANLFNMSMLALLAAINKRRPQECCVCFFSAPGCFHLVCIFRGFRCLVIQQSFFFSY